MNIKTVVTAFSIFLLLGGCNSAKNYAFLSHVYNCNGTQDYYTLTIYKPTNELYMNHSGLPSFNTLNYKFYLSTEPEGQTLYSTTMLKLDSEYIYPYKVAPEFISGSIVVDLNTREADVLLKIREGDFSGNGKYPFECTPPCESFHEPCDCSEYEKQNVQK